MKAIWSSVRLFRIVICRYANSRVSNRFQRSGEETRVAQYASLSQRDTHQQVSA